MTNAIQTSSEFEHADYQITINGGAWSTMRRCTLNDEIERVQGMIDREIEIYGGKGYRALRSFVEDEIQGFDSDGHSAVVVRPLTVRVERCTYDRAARKYSYETQATWTRGVRQ